MSLLVGLFSVSRCGKIVRLLDYCYCGWVVLVNSVVGFNSTGTVNTASHDYLFRCCRCLAVQRMA